MSADIYIWRVVFFIVICCGFFSCSRKEPKSYISSRDSLVAKVDSSTTEDVYTVATLDEHKGMYELKSYLTTVESLHKQTIDFDCVILIYPTEAQIERMKNDYGEEDFYIVADDNNWYQQKAAEIIDSLGIKRIIASEQYLILKGENKTWTLDIRRNNLPSWNLVFFKRAREPQIISTVSLNMEAARDFFEIPE